MHWVEDIRHKFTYLYITIHHSGGMETLALTCMLTVVFTDKPSCT